MDIDFKTISVVVGIASASLGLLYRIIPKRYDRLKKNLELLKLAKEAEVNYLPLLRHVNSIIHEKYVHKELSLYEKSELVLSHIILGVAISLAFFGLVGFVVSWLTQVAFELTEEKAEYILAGFCALGVLVGIGGGISGSKEKLKELGYNIEEKTKGIVEQDKKDLKGGNESEIILDTTYPK